MRNFITYGGILVVAVAVTVFLTGGNDDHKARDGGLSRSDRVSHNKNTGGGKVSRRRNRSPQTVTGKPFVVDGDSLEIGQTRIRLFGIDAPEGPQKCTTENGERWSCGRQSTIALRRLIGDNPVTCDRMATDSYDRMVARCRVNDRELNRWMVANGQALAYRKFTSDYNGDEQAAKADKRGLWRGDFTPPWKWRRQNR